MAHLLPGVAPTISFASGRNRFLVHTMGFVSPNRNGQIQLSDTGEVPFGEPKDNPMRKLLSVSLLILVTLPVAAAPKDKGKTTLKDVQPAGTTEKNHKHLQYDLSFSTTTGKDYTCRTKENEKPKATDMVVGSGLSYEVSGNKGNVKSTESKKSVKCTGRARGENGQSLVVGVPPPPTPSNLCFQEDRQKISAKY